MKQTTNHPRSLSQRRASLFLTAVLSLSFAGGAMAEAAQPAVADGKTGTELTLEGALTIALEEAQLDTTNVWVTKLKQDRDDGQQEYEVAFIVADMEYEYEISAETGKVTKASTETLGEKKKAAMQGSYLSMEEAKTKALEAAGITEAQAVFTEVQLDFDKDAEAKYEIEFSAGGQIYELELNAKTGEVLKSKQKTAKE